MAIPTGPSTAGPTIWHKLQAIDRRILYLILILVVTLFILIPIKLPNIPLPQSEKLYNAIADAPDGSLILISSGWTMSSRGETLPLYQALVRLCMRKNHHVLVVSMTEPAAAGYALSSLTEVAHEKGHKPYVEGRDWLGLGYLPNIDATIQSFATDFRGAMERVQVFGKPATSTDMLKDVRSLRDVAVVVDVSASASYWSFVERITGITKFGLMCTGVMFPEALPYQATGQLVGVAFGARGAYDFETMMAEDPRFEKQGGKFYGYGQVYMAPLTAAMLLLVAAIVVGNAAMAFARVSGPE
jgi:hypothetical protein